MNRVDQILFEKITERCRLYCQLEREPWDKTKWLPTYTVFDFLHWCGYSNSKIHKIITKRKEVMEVVERLLIEKAKEKYCKFIDRDTLEEILMSKDVEIRRKLIIDYSGRNGTKRRNWYYDE